MALISLPVMKNFLGIKADDVSRDMKLQLFIDAASETIEGITGRLFSKRTYLETVSGTGSDRIITMHYPILEVSSLQVAQDRRFDNPIALLAFGDYGISESNTEIVSYVGGFSRGKDNIQYSYKAGYETIPSDLQLACAWAAEWYYRQNNTQDIGVKSKGKGGESVSLSDALPPQIREIIQRYKRFEFPNISQTVLIA